MIPGQGNSIEDKYDLYGEDALGPLYGEVYGCPALLAAEEAERIEGFYGEIDLEFGSEIEELGR